MNILLIGQGPLPNDSQPVCAFPQLRTWTMQRVLKQAADRYGWCLRTTLLQPTLPKTIAQQLQTVDFTSVDVVVTAGPFYPFMALPYIPENTPVWVDFPSDPFADRDAKHRIQPLTDTEWNLVTQLRTMALQRADALGVISKRQQWVCTGSLLEQQATDVVVGYTPIAFDFPTPRQNKQAGSDFLIAGSANAWLDIRWLQERLQNETVHATGWHTHGYESIHNIPPAWTLHGWLPAPALASVIQQCSFGVWADISGIESTLGSRTRALFYLWSGLTPIGSLNTELATELHQLGCMRSWEDNLEPVDVITAQRDCMRHYAPELVFSPLIRWLENPSRIPRKAITDLAVANQRLRQQLTDIHQSPTWRIGSRVHRFVHHFTKKGR